MGAPLRDMSDILTPERGMKRTLLIEWMHARGNAGTCIRSADTAKTLQQLIDEVRPLLERDGFSVQVNHLDLAGEHTRDIVLLNGLLLETLIAMAGSGQTYCRSTKCMQVPEDYPRFVTTSEGICMEAPEILFRKAVLLALEETETVVVSGYENRPES
jgi:hypothetical protein